MGLKPRAGARITVRNVNVPGYESTVDAAKYTEMKRVLLKVLPKKGGLTQSEMMSSVKAHLSAELFPGGKTSGWWV